jgi:hypothetical protein
MYGSFICTQHREERHSSDGNRGEKLINQSFLPIFGWLVISVQTSVVVSKI